MRRKNSRMALSKLCQQESNKSSSISHQNSFPSPTTDDPSPAGLCATPNPRTSTHQSLTSPTSSSSCSPSDFFHSSGSGTAFGCNQTSFSFSSHDHTEPSVLQTLEECSAEEEGSWTAPELYGSGPRSLRGQRKLRRMSGLRTPPPLPPDSDLRSLDEEELDDLEESGFVETAPSWPPAKKVALQHLGIRKAPRSSDNEDEVFEVLSDVV